MTDHLDALTKDKIELLKRLMIWQADLQMSLSALTFLLEVDNDKKYGFVELRRFKCYETTFVIAYGRTFTKSDGSRHKQLSPKLIGVSLDDEEKEFHERILKARNKKYAHADLDFAHIRLDPIPLKMGEDFSCLVHRVKWDEGLEFIGGMLPYRIQDMISKFQNGLYVKTNDLVEELHDHLPIYLRPDGFD
ncbi:hypothetical protein [uncultured Cohaesibacter sp.]|uniref:hypothetical protein n=1 Tax=uncultured Cohaesibacter sp. TaxID=1002546 RepID=UPI0029C6013D|nr:hypothetical protein [uncultured Cohaesibacter sp.]